MALSDAYATPEEYRAQVIALESQAVSALNDLGEVVVEQVNDITAKCRASLIPQDECQAFVIGFNKARSAVQHVADVAQDGTKTINDFSQSLIDVYNSVSAAFKQIKAIILPKVNDILNTIKAIYGSVNGSIKFDALTWKS